MDPDIQSKPTHQIFAVWTRSLVSHNNISKQLNTAWPVLHIQSYKIIRRLVAGQPIKPDTCCRHGYHPRKKKRQAKTKAPCRENSCIRHQHSMPHSLQYLTCGGGLYRLCAFAPSRADFEAGKPSVRACSLTRSIRWPTGREGCCSFLTSWTRSSSS